MQRDTAMIRQRITMLSGGLQLTRRDMCRGLCLSALALQSNFAQFCQAAAPTGPKIYLVGNSLTWDTVPALLSGEVQWHVDCGRSLQQIYDRPASPCVATSKVWTTVLPSTQLDYLVVQPHYGTQLKQDLDVITRWYETQATATLVLHTGWAKQAELEKEFQGGLASDPLATPMIHCPEYFTHLRAELAKRFPNRNIRSTCVIQTLRSIVDDIGKGQAPLEKISTLYRDAIHFDVQIGRYLAHNLMRKALSQRTSTQGFQLDTPIEQYLNEKIAAADVES